MICDVVELIESPVASVRSKPHPYPRPVYSEKFRCLAQSCDENCCNGWSIPVDGRTQQIYLAHPVLKPFAQSLLVLNSAGNAVQMPLTHSGTCAFLNEEKLCGIHAHFGPALLSNACATYPRELTRHAGATEATLNLSCPEAARLTLLDPTLLGSGPWQLYGARRYAHIPSTTTLPAGFDPALALREFALLVLTDPTYLLWQRMHLLGTLAQHLDALAGPTSTRAWVEDHPIAIAALIARLARNAGHHLDLLPAIVPDTELQLRYTAEILRTRLAEAPAPDRFLAVVKDFQSGLGCNPSQTAPHADLQIQRSFQQAYRHHARPLLDRHPHLIENFIANHLFKYSYPFGRSPSGATPAPPGVQHLLLTGHLALIQTLLMGLAAFHGERLTPDHIVRLIQGVSKAIEHRPRSVEHLLATVRTNAPTLEGQSRLLALADETSG